MSSKKKALDRAYSSLRKTFLQNNPLCQCKGKDCTRIATEVHHMRGRGEYYLALDTWLAVCRFCHNWIENNPKEAKKLNFSMSRLTPKT